ncbi:hypothetical protein B484DRAFT_425795, partial [Ochromonadaceae sp. CCMP2298]
MNQPPRGGVLRVTPAIGTALSTFFFMSVGWVDAADDLPLTYALSYYTLHEMDQQTVKSPDTLPYVYSTLGQGLASLDYQVQGVVQVADVFGASTNATTPVQVLPLDSASAVELTLPALASAALGNNPTATAQAVSAALPSINAVNCSTPTPCSSINRQACERTAHTCGECLPGLVGAEGDSNIPCALASALVQTGGNCYAHADCLTASCVFNSTSNSASNSTSNSSQPTSQPSSSPPTSQPSGHPSMQPTGQPTSQPSSQPVGVCADVARVCPENCNSNSYNSNNSSNSNNSNSNSSSTGNGVCGYSSLDGTELDTCSVADTTCRARCNCTEGWFGRACAVNSTEYGGMLEFRQTLCAEMYRAVQQQDGAGVISARASAISSILMDSELVNAEALVSCTLALTQTVTQYPALACAGGVAQVAGALSSVLEKGSALPPALLSNVSAALVALSVGCQSI